MQAGGWVTTKLKEREKKNMCGFVFVRITKRSQEDVRLCGGAASVNARARARSGRKKEAPSAIPVCWLL